MSPSFEARYAGRCGDCGQAFSVGEPVSYNADDVLVGAECCDGEGRNADTFAPGRAAVNETMPRGKTARDKCPRCFQVPASNGVCGCH